MTQDEQGTAPKSGPHDYGYPAISPHQDTAVVQESLEDYRRTFAEQARDTGLRAAASNDAEWAERVLDWLYDLAPGVEVCADDVRLEFGTSSAMGSVFRTAAHRRVLQPIGL